MTVVEFLLARVADDEAQARRLDDYLTSICAGPHAFTHAPDRLPNGWAPPREVIYDPLLVLRHCAAQRIIIKTMQALLGEVYNASYADAVLWALAAAYGDHPDYASVVSR